MHMLLVNGNRHLLALVSVDSDDHLNSASDFTFENRVISAC